jgi:hypothetical protein
MSRRFALRHEFVKYVPETVGEGVIHISIRFATAVHLCFCGCGSEIATPFSPADWQLTFDGQTVSLDPSIGNWSLPCRSHYWIRKNRVVWARPWTPREIAEGRELDRLATEEQFAKTAMEQPGDADGRHRDEPPPRETLWRRIRRAFS